MELDKSNPHQKKKRNLPGMPDPNAEVIALSPETLMATNRFVCEVCNKGFQRDQNLQLHRRGHNLPWKLRQRTSNEIVKRVYVCPEISCVHHNPSRALGDLTGIKKHFCRKHGEKKLKCERCAKKYAVRSDWKAHLKTCGTREYTCGCGTIFSRRDSFIAHRAFCDALVEENSKAKTVNIVHINSEEDLKRFSPKVTGMSPALSIHSPGISENHTGTFDQKTATTSISSPSSTTSNGCGTAIPINNFSRPSLHFNNVNLSENCSSFFPLATLNQKSHYEHYNVSSQAAMSATALLQKASQIGSSMSKGSLLLGLGLDISSSDNQERMMGLSASSSVFGSRPTTLDLFGLGSVSLYGEIYTPEGNLNLQ